MGIREISGYSCLRYDVVMSAFADITCWEQTVQQILEILVSDRCFSSVSFLHVPFMLCICVCVGLCHFWLHPAALVDENAFRLNMPHHEMLRIPALMVPEHFNKPVGL